MANTAELEFTPEQIVEYARCMDDPIYFIENYCYIIGPAGKQLFKLYDYQKRLIRTYVDFERCIAMISRQMGKSQTAAAYLLWWAIFKADQTVLVASNKGASAKEIMVRIKAMYYDLPEWLRAKMINDNVMELVFDNGSRIIGETTTPNTGRGKSIHLLYLDEFAFVAPNVQSALWTSIYPTLTATRGRLIITSTPNTDEDRFARLWYGAHDAPESSLWTDEFVKKKNEAHGLQEVYETVYEDEVFRFEEEPIKSSNKNGDADGFRRFYALWNEHPDRDENFKQKTLAEGISMSEWMREFECVFASGDTTLIDAIWLMRLNAYVRKPRLVDKHGTRWYHTIKPNKAYCVMLDPNEGVGGDNGVIQVWALPDMVQVAEWAKNDVNQLQQAKQLARILTKIDDELQSNPEQIGESSIYYSIECNGVGMGVVNMIANEESNLPGYFIDSDGNKVRGIRTTEPSKKEYSFRLKTMIERGVFVPHSKALVSEFKTFVKRGKNFSAKQGSKDDRVMSCVLMCHMLDELVYHEDGIEDLVNPRLMGEEIIDAEDEEEIAPMPMC